METTSLTFGSPAWLYALAVVPLIAALFWWSQKRAQQLVARIVAKRLFAHLAGSVSLGRRFLRACLVLGALALILVSLAKPRSGYKDIETKQRGRDVLIAIDTSRSMLSTDVAPTRLARAKLLALDLARLLQGDRLGLIAFAGSAFLQAPLTLDQGAVLTSLDELDTNVIPKGGTDIAAAIRAAEDAFGKAEGTTRALVIITDGEELDANGVAAAKQASEHGIRIFTVGVGTPEGSLIPIRNEDGRQDFVRDRDGKPVNSKLDAARLSEIAQAAGGFYLPIGPDTAREIFVKGIEPITESDAGVMSFRQPIEIYRFPLSAAIALLALWLVIGEKRRTPRTARRAAGAMAAGLIIAVSVAGTGSVGAATTGIQNYQSGDYKGALQDFEQRIAKQPDSDKLQFNAGASAYKLGDAAKAVEHFTKALLTSDTKLREDAAYNLGNSLVRRGEAATAPDAKKADWKNAIQQYDEVLRGDPKNQNAKENRDLVKKLLEDLDKQQKQDQKKDQKQDQKQDKKQDQKDKQDQQQSGGGGKDQKQDQQNKQDQKDPSQGGGKDQQKDQKQDQKNDPNKQDQKNDSSQGSGQDKQSSGGNKDQQKDPKDQQDKKDPSQGAGGKDQKDDQQKQQGDQKNDPKGDQQKNDQPNGSGQDQKQDQQKQPSGQGGDQQKPQQNQPGQEPKPAEPQGPGDKKSGEIKSAGGGQDEKAQPAGEGQAAAVEEGKDGEMTAAQAQRLLNAVRGEEDRVKFLQRKASQDVLRDW